MSWGFFSRKPEGIVDCVRQWSASAKRIAGQLLMLLASLADGHDSFEYLPVSFSVSRFPSPLKFEQFVPLVPSRIRASPSHHCMASIRLLRRRRHLGPVREKPKTITRFTLRHPRVLFLCARCWAIQRLTPVPQCGSMWRTRVVQRTNSGRASVFFSEPRAIDRRVTNLPAFIEITDHEKT